MIQFEKCWKFLFYSYDTRTTVKPSHWTDTDTMGNRTKFRVDRRETAELIITQVKVIMAFIMNLLSECCFSSWIVIESRLLIISSLLGELLNVFMRWLYRESVCVTITHTLYVDFNGSFIFLCCTCVVYRFFGFVAALFGASLPVR